MFNKLLLLLLITSSTFAQNKDSTKTASFFTGQITATNNGISLIPSFSLGKPAVLFDLSIGKGKLSFDPMLRWGMNGKPWSFVFWWRYKIVNNEKFKISLGAHPSVVFRDVSVVNNGITKDYLTAQRFFAWEVAPSYFVNKKLGFAVSYLGATGLTKDLVKNTTFLAFRSIMPAIPLGKQYNLSFVPQVFYLKMDKLDGFYANSTIGISKKKFPISISSIMSKKIKSDIAGKDFLWNLQLNYNLNNRYFKIR